MFGGDVLNMDNIGTWTEFCKSTDDNSVDTSEVNQNKDFISKIILYNI